MTFGDRIVRGLAVWVIEPTSTSVSILSSSRGFFRHVADVIRCPLRGDDFMRVGIHAKM
jgi:hypothetical protein